MDPTPRIPKVRELSIRLSVTQLQGKVSGYTCQNSWRRTVHVCRGNVATSRFFPVELEKLEIFRLVPERPEKIRLIAHKFIPCMSTSITFYPRVSVAVVGSVPKSRVPGIECNQVHTRPLSAQSRPPYVWWSRPLVADGCRIKWS